MVDFAYSAIASGFTGSHDDVSTAGQSYIPSTPDQGFGSIWCGIITGSDAWIKATSHFPGAMMPSLDVSVDGGAFTTVTTGPEAGYYSLLSGLSDTPHFVAFKRPPSLNDYIYIDIQAATLKVTGAAPSVSPAGEWLEAGNLASKTITANGLVPTTFRNPPEGFGPGYQGTGRTPLMRPALDGTFNGTTYAKTGATGRQPFLTVKTTSTELYVVSQARYVNILIGSTLTQYDSGTAAAAGGGAVRSRRITGLPAGDKTMHVFPSCLTTTPQGQWFSVGVPAGQSFGTVTGLKRAHIWADSIGQGVQSGSFGDEQMSGLTDIPRAFTALGYTTGLFGVSGSKYADYQAATAGDLAGQLAVLTVAVGDVAYVALGQNSPTTAPEVTYFVNQLIAKGYGKVIVRGVLPTITNSHTAQNTIIKGAVDAIVDAKLVYIDPTTWTEFAVNTAGFRDDGIHLSPTGYDALLSRMAPALSAILAVASAFRFSTATINAALDAIETAIGASAILKIRSGAAPTNVAAADTGTVLATLALPSNWMDAAASRTKAKLGTWEDLLADATGTAGHFRIYANDGVTPHIQGPVVTGTEPTDGQLVLTNTSIVAGQPISVTSFVIDGQAA